MNFDDFEYALTNSLGRMSSSNGVIKKLCNLEKYNGLKTQNLINKSSKKINSK